MPRLIASAVSACVLLAACQATEPPESTPLSPAASAAPATGMPGGDHSDTPSETARLQGRATYRERMLPPPGSVLTVQLIDNLLADTPKAVIADTTVTGIAAPPFAFELTYPVDALRDNGMYGLHAALRGPDGRLLFVTDTRVPVTPGSHEHPELMMVRVAGNAAAGADTPRPERP